MALPAIDFTGLAQAIAAAVRRTLCTRPARGESLCDPADLKSHHSLDRQAGAAARDLLAGYRCNLIMEGERQQVDADAEFCVYIDPLDGSLNWDRGIGDPAFVLAVAPGTRAECLDALEFAYVEGLRSGDRYSADGLSGAHYDAVRATTRPLGCHAPKELTAATAYLRCGYGGARAQLEHSLALLLAVRDVRAVDNAAIELGDIARNAAHLMVEARGISDGFNLLAYPLVRAAGGVAMDLAGNDLGPQPFSADRVIDYVVAGNGPLARAAVETMARWRPEQWRCLQRLDPR